MDASTWMTYLASDGCWIKQSHLVGPDRRRLCGGRAIREGSRWRDGAHRQKCGTCLELSAARSGSAPTPERAWETYDVVETAEFGTIMLRAPLRGNEGWMAWLYEKDQVSPVRQATIDAGVYLGTREQVLADKNKKGNKT